MPKISDPSRKNPSKKSSSSLRSLSDSSAAINNPLDSSSSATAQTNSSSSSIFPSFFSYLNNHLFGFYCPSNFSNNNNNTNLNKEEISTVSGIKLSTNKNYKSYQNSFRSDPSKIIHQVQLPIKSNPPSKLSAIASFFSKFFYSSEPSSPPSSSSDRRLLRPGKDKLKDLLSSSSSDQELEEPFISDLVKVETTSSSYSILSSDISSRKRIAQKDYSIDNTMDAGLNEIKEEFGIHNNYFVSPQNKLLPPKLESKYEYYPRSSTPILLKDSILIKSHPRSASAANDVINFLLLTFLYLFQGIPFGLAFGSIPFLLKSLSDTNGASFSDIGLFSLASYPYTLKILWSPIVDAFYWPGFGRRKSWIFPMQLSIGLTFLWMGQNVEQLIYHSPPNIILLTSIFMWLIVLCATQDIAVDGWALTVLTKKNIRFGSAAQTVGLNTGYFLSFTVFLALNSAEFCNKYLRSEPSEVGLLTLNSYLTFWGLACLVLTFLILLKPEPLEADNFVERDLKSAYMTIWRMLKLPYMKILVVVLLLHKFGYLANEIVSPLKLIEKGFRKEDLALVVLIDFPFQILFGFLAVRWSSGDRPLQPWLYATYMRHFLAAIGMLVVYFFPAGGVTTGYFLIVMLLTGCSSFMSTIMFVSQGAFFSVISDPLVGGTYMTFLHTFSNFGGTWPRYFILKGVDVLSLTRCILKDKDENAIYRCSNEEEKLLCQKLQGSCEVNVDGYYIVAATCMLFGLMIMVFYIHRKIRKIETLSPDFYWRLHQRNL